MKAGYKEKIKYMVKYAIYSFIEAVLLLFKIIRNGFKERR
jgi:hypothetical protein